MPLNAVIDLSHNNGPVDLQLAKDAGVLAVIHKATQGVTFSDSMFRSRMNQCEQLGLLRGAYHFLDSTDGAKQAAHFLATVNDFPDALLAVDIENEPVGPSAELGQLYDFINLVYAKNRRWPVIYGGFYLRQLLGGQQDALLSNCALWVSDYRSNAQPEIPSAFKQWALWQYTDGTNGNPPHSLAGIRECDRDIFNGESGDDLRAFWTGAAAAQGASA